MKRIYVVGTADTKGEELAYLAERIAAAGGEPVTVDVGTTKPSIEARYCCSGGGKARAGGHR